MVCTLQQRLSQIRHTLSADDQAPSVPHNQRQRERQRERERERERYFFLKDYREIFAGIWIISTQRRSPADLLSDCPACTKGDELPEKSTKVACMHASWLLLAMPVLFNHTKRQPLRPAWPWGLASPSFIAGQGPAGRPDSRPDMSTCMKSGSFT